MQSLLSPQESDLMWDFDLKASVSGSENCPTGLRTRLEFIDNKGRAKGFTKEGDGFYYNLKRAEEHNIFRLTAETLSGSEQNEDTNLTPRQDRIRVMFLGYNSAYAASVTAQVLQQNPDLIKDGKALEQAIADNTDQERLWAILQAETLTTDQSGSITRDFDIPADWPPGPVYVFVDYGYDFASEKATAALGSEAEVINWSILMAEIILGFIFPVKFLVEIGVYAAAFVASYLLSPDVRNWTHNLMRPLGGKNQYGCHFPDLDQEPLRGLYLLNYKSEVEELSELMSTQQADFINQLIESEEQQVQNETIVLMSIVGAIALGIVVAAMRRGSDV